MSPETRKEPAANGEAITSSPAKSLPNERQSEEEHSESDTHGGDSEEGSPNLRSADEPPKDDSQLVMNLNQKEISKDKPTTPRAERNKKRNKAKDKAAKAKKKRSEIEKSIKPKKKKAKNKATVTFHQRESRFESSEDSEREGENLIPENKYSTGDDIREQKEAIHCLTCGILLTDSTQDVQCRTCHGWCCNTRKCSGPENYYDTDNENIPFVCYECTRNLEGEPVSSSSTYREIQEIAEKAEKASKALRKRTNKAKKLSRKLNEGSSMTRKSQEENANHAKRRRNTNAAQEFKRMEEEIAKWKKIATSKTKRKKDKTKTINHGKFKRSTTMATITYDPTEEIKEGSQSKEENIEKENQSKTCKKHQR